MTQPIFDVGYADEYVDAKDRAQIQQRYQARWQPPVMTPNTHPWLYDPLQPPLGWRYDAYYELWIQT